MTLNNPRDGEKMRFIPSPQYVQNTGIYERYSELINRQSWYINCSNKMTSFEITDLDTKASELRCTLREMIMEMKTTQGNPLFLSVDVEWNSGIVPYALL